MSSNINQRSIDQAQAEIKRADEAIEDALMKLRKPVTVPDGLSALAEARKRLALAQRHLK
jgi:hypothetical protein